LAALGHSTDFYLERERLHQLIAYLYACADHVVDQHARAGVDAVIAWEERGLQDMLMISPQLWRSTFKAPMAQTVNRICRSNIKYVLRSCRYILDIIEDLIEIGVDVPQPDQRRIMGIDNLAGNARRACFFNPVNIQFASRNDDLSAIRRYAQEMALNLTTPAGGLMYKTYAQPRACEISYEAIEAECGAFQSVSPYQ
jgi:hypothetical protein